MAYKSILKHDPDNINDKPQLPCDNCKKLTNFHIVNGKDYMIVNCYKCDLDDNFAFDEHRDSELSFGDADHLPEPF